MKYFNRIIGGAATGGRFITDQAGIANAPNIHAKTLMIIIAPKFTSIFADAINGNGFYNGLLRAIYFW